MKKALVFQKSRKGGARKGKEEEEKKEEVATAQADQSRGRRRKSWRKLKMGLSSGFLLFKIRAQMFPGLVDGVLDFKKLSVLDELTGDERRWQRRSWWRRSFRATPCKEFVCV